MKFKELLEMDPRLVNDEKYSCALKYAEQLWLQASSPTDPPKLLSILRKILDGCSRQRLMYPKILLRRKADLQRGEWKPGMHAAGLWGLPFDWYQKAAADSARIHREREEERIKLATGEKS
ncbi:MAG TPA: hypothetical protein VMU24_10075 [Candidatus Acidoferrales bacterium]|nr:hypothetical protein [Candidatus Acidoferrales bacterium]